MNINRMNTKKENTKDFFVSLQSKFTEQNSLLVAYTKAKK